jgi:hypothetical protein
MYVKFVFKDKAFLILITVLFYIYIYISRLLSQTPHIVIQY